MSLRYCKRQLARFAALLVAVAAPSVADAASFKVYYPAVQHPYFAKRDVYFVKLLEMALERSGEEYELIAVNFSEYSEKRSVLLIQSGQYDLHWLNTTADRERELLPVRIPLYKGAIGWRAMFIRPEMQSEFAKVKTVEDLKKFVFVQGHDWADVEILLENGFALERSSNWLGLFKMVALGRADALPRSVVEILEEKKEEVAKELAIERSLILHYPAAYYFFVDKNNQKLQRMLETGLRNSLHDGSFDRLFFETFGEQIAKLQLHKRRVISVEHPKLQQQLPIDDKTLWFSASWFEEIQKKHSSGTD